MFDSKGNALEVTAERTGSAFDITGLLSLTDAKAFLKVDGTAEDADVTAKLSGARDVVQGDTGHIFGAETWRIVLNEVPADGVIELPIWPVRSVTSIHVLDEAYSAAEFSSAHWQSVLTVKPARVIALSSGPGWPSVGAKVGGISIVVAAGYVNAAAVPLWLLEAMKIKLAALYQGIDAGKFDPAYEALIADGRLSWAG